MLYNNAKIGNAGILKKRFGISSHNSNEIYLSNSYRSFTTEYYFLNVNLYALHFPQFDKIQKYHYYNNDDECAKCITKINQSS